MDVRWGNRYHSFGHHWAGGGEGSMIFKVFGVYFGDFLMFLHEIFFGSKILPSSCDKHQHFDYGCSRYPGNEAQSPDFGKLLTIFGIFRAVCLGASC